MSFKVGKLYEYLERGMKTYLFGPNCTKIPWDIHLGTVIMVLALEKAQSPNPPNHMKILTDDGIVGWGYFTPGLWKQV